MDIYQTVTDSIINAIENNPGEVQLPWDRTGATGLPTNVQSGQHYRGINVLNLWIAEMCTEFTSSTWGTYKQWQDRGAQVKKGQRSSLIIFYKEIDIENDQEGDGKRRIIRSSRVFNADQVDGWAETYHEGDPIDRILVADSFVAQTGAVIHEGGAKAYYSPKHDDITMPDEARFFDTRTSTRTEGYYSTLFHELGHWSGSEERLNRDLSGRFGSESYALEELVAELVAAYTCSWLGIAKEPREDHARYLSSWLKVLKEDKKAIFTAAAKAQEATDYLVAFMTK